MNRDVKRRRQKRIRQLFGQEGHSRFRAETHSRATGLEQSWQEWRDKPSKKQFFYKWLIAFIIYVIVLAAFHINHPLAAKAERVIHSMLTESFDFAKVAVWYENHIGQLPSFLPAFGERIGGNVQADYTLPVSGIVVNSYSNSSKGIWLATQEDQSVTAIGTGLVEYVGQLPATGLTIIVRHSNGVQSIYGGLESVIVEKNDWLKGGAEIGQVKTLYFAVKQDKQFIDPGEVIPFD